MKILSSFLIAICLVGCSTKADLNANLIPPIRAPLERVPVQTRTKDMICPPDAHYFLSEEAFKNLIINNINSETYIRQLENLLNSLNSK